jgi:Endonuclease-reverse transcriptase
LLASVYMPVDVCGGQTDEDFEFVCGCLNALIAESHVSGYILAGDFNFPFNSSRHKTIMKALDDHLAIVVDEYALDASSFTYVSDSHNTTSWLDHVLTNQNMLSYMSNLSVLYDFVSSDHRPLRFCINIDKVNYVSICDSSCTQILRTVSDWAACSQSDIHSYTRKLKYLLQSVP